jgi:hypothetical protein
MRTNSDLAAIVEDLKPYLRGEKKIALDDERVDLAAAILIPRDIESHIVRPAGKPSARAEVSDTVPAGEQIASEWHGTLNIGEIKLRLVLKTQKQPGGALTATLDSVDQGAFNMHVDSVSLDGKTLRFEVSSIQGFYEGTLDKQGAEAVSQWTQGRQSLPLTLALMQSANLAAHTRHLQTDNSLSSDTDTYTWYFRDSILVRQYWSVNASDPTLRDEIERVINSKPTRVSCPRPGCASHQKSRTNIGSFNKHKKKKGKRQRIGQCRGYH